MRPRKGPGGIKTESRSPITAIGVATPKSHASKSITVVMTMPATAPARIPAPAVFEPLKSSFISRERVLPWNYSGRLVSSPLESDAKKCRENARPREQRSAQRPRNFRLSAGPATVVDRHLDDPQLRAGRAHLHLQVPPIGLLAHSKPHQGLAPNRAEGAHVAVAHTVKQTEQSARGTTGKDLLKIHASRLPLTAHTRANNKIRPPLCDRIDESIHQLWTIAAVAIEKNDDLGSRIDSRDTGRTGASVTARRCHDPRSRGSRLFGRAIGAPGINDDDFVRQTSR